MKIAVTNENGTIFQHFGHTESFCVYEICNNKIIDKKIICTNGKGHGALAEFLKNMGIDILICGGIGGGAQAALENCGIKLYGGASGKCDDAVEAFLSSKLEYNPNVKCEHHHDNEGHNCGENGCVGNCVH